MKLNAYNHRIINKTMALEDIESAEALAIADGINCLIKGLIAKNLRTSSWYGRFNLKSTPRSHERVNRGYDYRSIEGAVDDRNFPWFLYWEIVWVVLNNQFLPGHKVLDLGGSSSLFSYYLASQGIEVVTIDLNKELVENANLVARETGWNLKNYVMDMRELNFDSRFDHITSICVYEHIPICDRVAINKRIKDLLVEGGRFSITFDYRNPSRLALIGSPKDVHEQFVKSSGLRVRGNADFMDNGNNYLLHPFYYKKRLWIYKAIQIARGHFRPWEFLETKATNDYTFGALFLEK